jgi:ABC-type oligopeptide transport system substrate-binding subunit
MGDAILAFFGAPIAHEDDAERAVHAALAITEGARQYAKQLEAERDIKGFGVRAGIHTGLVVVGEVGSDLRVEYTAMGDAVNLAARLEQHAPPGGVLISHDTYRHVRGLFDVVPQPPLVVKGKTEPVQTYLVQRAKPRPFRKPIRGVEGIETRMVGREAELKHLQDAFHTTREDIELQVVTVTGDAGVGKSRLLHEFDIWAEALPDQYCYFKGRAYPEMQDTPYSLIRNLITFRFQIQDSDTPRVVREKLEGGAGVVLGDDANSRIAAHYLGHLVGLEFGDSEHLAGILDDAQAFRDQALACLVDYFARMASQRTVLILLEDLHWADDSSLDALNHLMLALADQPLMIACVARPTLLERRPHWGEGQPFHSDLMLRPLSKWDSRRLVVEILQKVPEVPQALRDLIVAGAEGNPFFIEELVKMLIEDGIIVKGEEQWRLEPARMAEIRVPQTLNGVLQARLDRLPVEERTVLQQASVVGRLFWDRAVARIHESTGEGVEPDQLAESLSELRNREMVYRRETSAFVDAQEYIFRHALLREVTYGSVLKRLRRTYHGLVADWLLEQAGERVEELTALIADHLALAGRTAEAVDYLQQAGDRARNRYAHQEAIRAYERTLALLKEGQEYERAARTLMKLGLTYHLALDFQRTRQAYEEGFALWQRAGEVQEGDPPPPAPHALRVGLGLPRTLDPTMPSDTFSVAVIDQLFSGLAERTPALNILPDVAQSWEVSEGGRRYVFHLRADVRWSDGKPLTAEDFEYTWKRALDPASKSPVSSLMDDVKDARAFHQGIRSDPDQVGVRALDDFTLVVELEGPTGYFPHLLALCRSFPVPRHVVEEHGEAWTAMENIVTSGPFKVETWQQGQSAVLVRNDAYHGRSTGNVHRVEMSLLADPSARLALYEADELDLFHLCDLPAAELDRARHRWAGEYVSVPTLSTHYMGFHTSRPPFDDPRVRRAFVLATDRVTMVDTVWSGIAFPATGGFVPPGMLGHSAGIALPYDPDQARRLLAEAGYPGGRGFPAVTLPTDHRRERHGEYLQAQWRENLGIEITRELMDWDTFLDRLCNEPPQLFCLGETADYPDPDDFLRVRASVFTGWQNPEYGGLVQEARRVTHHDERMKTYQAADRILIEEASIMPFAYGQCHLLLKPWVRRCPTSATKFWFWKDVIIDPH